MTNPVKIPCADGTRPDVALITGGARRIGAVIAARLADAGHPVVIHANRSREEADALAETIRAQGGRCAVVTGDLADPAATSALMVQAAEPFGPVSILVNNASLFERDEIGTLDGALWDRHFAVNLRAPVFLAEDMARHLPDKAHGIVINILDQRVFKLTPQFISYTLTKAALATATTTMAQALGPRIRVVGVAPGPTLANERQSAADFARQCAAVPLGTGSTPHDIAETVLFLVRTPSITGQIIAVDGGQHLAWETPDVAGIVE